MKRFCCAFIAVIAACVAGFGYMLVYEDQMDPRAAANVGKGIFAPMWRHFVEYAVVVSMTWPAVAFVFYTMFGTDYEIAVLRSARARLYPLHFVSFGVFFTGFFLCLANGQMIAFRDAIMGAAAIGALCVGLSERSNARSNVRLMATCMKGFAEPCGEPEPPMTRVLES